ncbi:MAG: ATP-binding protein [Anaerolineae bacterium]
MSKTSSGQTSSVSAREPAGESGPLSASACEMMCHFSERLAGLTRLSDLRAALPEAALAACPAAGHVWLTLLDERNSMAGTVGDEGPSCLADLIGDALTQLRPVYHPDLRTIPGHAQASEVSPWRSLLIIPLLSGGRAIGALTLAAEVPDAFPATERHMLAVLAGQAASTLENARLLAELRRQKHHAEAVFRYMADGLIVLDRRGRITALNPAAETMLGLEEAEVLGWSPMDAIPDGRYRALAEICQAREEDQALSHPALLDMDEHRAHPEVVVEEPTPRVLRVLSSTIGNGSGGGQVRVLQDVTRERELEQMQHDFVSTVSHELRTPLFSIKGFVDLMLKGKVPDPAIQQEFLTRVAQQANHLAAIVNDLLDVSRFQAGTIELERATVDLADIAQQVIERLEPVARTSSITLRLEAPPTLPCVRGDQRRLLQVLTNLVSNAIKFSHANSEVLVRCLPGEGEVMVQVKDHGVGIPPEAQSRLFSRFYQVDHTETRRAGGTGLGLYISRRIVQAHSGRIWVESQVGQGSTFAFAIPTIPETQQE